MLDALKSLATFAAVMEAGSFRGAAGRLGLSPSTVSYHINELERHMGAPLLNRSTRHISLIALGESILPGALAVLAEAETMTQRVHRPSGRLQGRFRVTVTSAVMGSGFGEAVAAFRNAHPDVHFELDASDTARDLIRDRFDLAIRAGRLENSTQGTRRLGQIRRVLVCSPNLLATGSGEALQADWQDQPWIRLAAMSSRRPLVNPVGELVEIETRDAIIAGSIEAMIELALAGMGLATPPAHRVHAALGEGRLVEAAPGWQVPPIELHAVWPAQKTKSPVRLVFLEHLMKSWARNLT